MCPVRPEIHLCFLQNFVLSKKTSKFVFPSRFWCQSNYHPKKIKMTQKNFSYNPIFRAHFWDEKTRAELPTYIYVVGPTGDVQNWRIYTSLVVKELIKLKVSSGCLCLIDFWNVYTTHQIITCDRALITSFLIDNTAGMVATKITCIGEWGFTKYRRNAQFLIKI